MKIKFIKDTDITKIGEIFESSKGSAENYVSQGFAVYVDEKENKINKKDLSRTYKLLQHQKQTELRFIEANKERSQIISKFISNEKEFIESCSSAPTNFNLYLGLNERSPNGKKDEDVTALSLYDFDIDPVRKKNTCSTEAELKTAEVVADQISDYLVEQGFRKPSKAMSGNGFQLWCKLVPIEIKTDEHRKVVTEQLKAFEGQVRSKFATSEVNIDSVHNLSRIMKIIGTKSVKGTHTKERPQRLSKWIYYDEDTSRDEKLTDHILNLDVEEVSKNVKLDKVTKKKDTSKSGREYREVLRLLFTGKTKEEIFSEMEAFTKWSSESEQYRELTYKNAFEYYNKEKEPKKQKYKIKVQVEEEDGKSYFGVKGFNKATKVSFTNNSQIYDHVEPTFKNESLYYKVKYTLYEGSIGCGNNTVFIKSKYRLEIADKEIFISPIPNDELEEILWKMKHNFIFYTLCKKLFIPITKGEGNKKEKRERKEVIVDILDRDLTFFKTILPVDKKKIMSLEEPFETIQKILKNGLDKDEVLDYIYMADIPEINPFSIKPSYYMRFSPHKIITTNQKTGKTSLSTTITNEPAFESATQAGLIGFATADKRNYGILHKRIKPSYIEEVQEEKGEELFGKLHSLMEQGETTIPKGIGLSIETFSSITFQGNPKVKDDVDSDLQSYLMIEEFKNILNTISKNIKPFSSRIGLVLFDKELKTVKGVPNDKETTNYGKQILRTIAEAFRDEFTKLYYDKEIFNWLNQGFDEKYTKNIGELASNCSDKMVREFFLGQIDSFRHTKGIAIRLAWLDVGLKEIWFKEKIDTSTIIKSAEYHLGRIKRINAKSYATISSMLNSSAYKQLLKYNLDTLKPVYLKLALHTLLEKLTQNNDNSKIIPLSLLDPYYSKVKQNNNIKESGKYWSFTKVVSSIETFQKNLDDDLREFGLSFDRMNLAFVIIDNQTLTTFLNIYQNNNSELGQVGQEGQEGHNNIVEEVIS